MIEDNTPTVNSKTRKPTSHKRLRLQKAKADQKVTAGIKKKKEEGKTQKKRKDAGPITARVPHVKKGTLQKPPVPKAKFRKRQIHKAWLPTHLYHTKRAHMTPPKEPLWRMAIPLSPTAKSYRPTHRAAGARGAIAWDMSYMSTIGLEGSEKSLVGLFKHLGVATQHNESWWATKAKRWISGARSLDSWVYEGHDPPAKAVAPVTILWQRHAQSGNLQSSGEKSDEGTKRRPIKRQAFVRVHPSAFLQLWKVLLGLSQMQKPVVAIEDLRYEIGTIDVTGPASTEALIAVLQPWETADAEAYGSASSEVCWSIMKSVSNPSVLPCNAVLAFDIMDPRLRHPPRTISINSTAHQQQQSLQMLAAWPVDVSHEPAHLFERPARVSASRQLPSQKAINKRKALAAPGKYPDASTTDPRIPVIILPSRGCSSGQGTWTVLLPWKCVLSVWYSLMFYPLTTGGTIGFGGLQQKMQTSFEQGMPWFPGDFPGTAAGMEWENQQREKRRHDWAKRPKGKRVEYESIDLGRGQRGEIGLGWACDWERLIKGAASIEAAHPASVAHVTGTKARKCLRDPTTKAHQPDGSRPLAIVKLTMLQKGVPSSCARIYCMPTTDQDLRKQFLALVDARANPGKARTTPRPTSKPRADAPAHVRRQALAASLLDAPPQVGENAYPLVPDEVDLVGFVTTGNFNLAEGKGSGIGSLLLDRVLAMPSHIPEEEARRQRHLCVVRDSGQRFGRLARWELI